jgi:hypothetical protein
MLLTLLFTCLPFFSASMTIDFPSTAHDFFPERLTNHCQGLRRTFPRICTQFVAFPLSDPLQNRIRLDTQLQIKGRKKISTSTQLREMLYTNSQDMIVLSTTVASRYYNCCTNGSSSPGNCGHNARIHTPVRP